MDNINSNNSPFIKVDATNIVDVSSSPFHAMEDDNDMILVKSNPSDFSIPPAKNKAAVDGIMMVSMTGNPNLDEEIDQDQVEASYSDDNNSINSTLKVHQGSADFDYDMKRGKIVLKSRI